MSARVIDLFEYPTARAIPLEQPVMDGSVWRGLKYALIPSLLFWAAFAGLGWVLGLML